MGGCHCQVRAVNNLETSGAASSVLRSNGESKR
jgi:hypothetical protein